MFVNAPRRIRLELDPAAARSLHAALAAALAAELVPPDDVTAAREVLARLDRRVPGWVQGAEGYERGADAVLGALAAAEEAARAGLGVAELAGELDAGGTSLGGLLDRMAQERLVRRTEHDGRDWIAIAPAGRRRLGARRAATEPAPPLNDPGDLVDLIYAEHRPGRWAHRPAVQAIGRLDDAAFGALAAELRRRGLLEPAGAGDDATIALTDAGAELARERWAAAAPAGEPVPHWRMPPPPLPYRPLPVTVEASDRACPSAGCSGRASWLTPSGSSARWRALLRDGSAEWTCPSCSRAWLVYLQAHGPDGAPVYVDLAAADHNRPAWRRAR